MIVPGLMLAGSRRFCLLRKGETRSEPKLAVQKHLQPVSPMASACKATAEQESYFCGEQLPHGSGAHTSRRRLNAVMGYIMCYGIALTELGT